MSIPGLELLHGRTYTIRFRAENYLGMENTGCVTSSVLIDTTPPRAGLVLVLQHDSQNEDPLPTTQYYQYSLKVMRIATRNFTDPESDILGFWATVYRASDDWVMQPETYVGTRDFVTFNADLQDRETFYVQLKALNKAELATYVTSANVTVDATPPIIDYVRDTFGPSLRFLGGNEADVVGSTELEIHTLFNARDPESGIQSVTWCLGSFPGACDVVQPIEVHAEMAEAQQSVGGLIDSARYYPMVSAYNHAGNWESLVSDGFFVDVSAPICAELYDGPGYDRKFIGPTVARANEVEGESGKVVELGELQLSWLGFNDFMSGIGGFAAATVPSALLNLADSTNTGFLSMGLAGSTSFLRELVHSETYYGVVKVWDNLGNENTCYSDGVFYDNTPPVVASATLISLLAVNAWNVQNVAHLVHAEVRGIFDPESGIRQYDAAVGEPGGDPEAYAAFRFIGTSEGEMLMGGLQMPEGAVQVTVRTYNNAKEPNEVALLMGVDTVPPRCDPIQLWQLPPGTKFAYTEETSELQATWNCSDVSPWSHSPISCEWAIASFPGGDDLMAWSPGESNGTHSYSCNGCFENGILYFVNVKCTDQVGLSSMSTSGGLMPDLNGPIVATPAMVVTRYTGRATRWWGYPSDLSMIWGFDDLESGIKRIRALLDSSETSPLSGPKDVEGLLAMPLELPADPNVGHTIIELAEQGVELGNGGSYYLHVCAEDHMNHTTCSEPYIFTVDLTPPQCRAPDDRVASLAPASIFSTRAGFGAVWECVDHESGVTSTNWMPYGDSVPLLTSSVMMLGGELAGEAAWRGTGARTVVIPYVDGMHFHSCVTAINGAELYSLETLACSAGATSDFSAPFFTGELVDEQGQAFQQSSTVMCTTLPVFYDNTSGVNVAYLEVMQQVGSDSYPLGAPLTLNTSTYGLDRSESTICRNVTMDHGAQYFSRLLVMNNALPYLSSQVRSKGFRTDDTAPVAGRATLRMLFPNRFESQANFPASVRGTSVRVRLQGFSDDQSGVKYYNISLRLNGSVIAHDTHPSGLTSTIPPYEVLMPEIYNGSQLQAFITGVNRVGLVSEMVSAEKLVILGSIELNDPWFVVDLSPSASASSALIAGEPEGARFLLDEAASIGFKLAGVSHRATLRHCLHIHATTSYPALALTYHMSRDLSQWIR